MISSIVFSGWFPGRRRGLLVSWWSWSSPALSWRLLGRRVQMWCAEWSAGTRWQMRTNSAAWCTFLRISIPSRPYLCHGKSRRLLELEGLVFSGTKFVCRMSSNLTSPHSCFHAPVQGVLPEVELGFSCSKQNVFAKSRVVRIRMRNASGRLLEHKWARMLAQPVANCSFPVTISSWPHAIATHTSTDTKQKKETRTCTDCTCTFARAHAYVDRRHTHTQTDRDRCAQTHPARNYAHGFATHHHLSLS